MAGAGRSRELSAFSRFKVGSEEGATSMGKRWSAEDIRDLKTLAERYSVQAIAEKMDRSVGGVSFKAYQLALPLKARSQAIDPAPADLN
jgi:hypothetical protein